MATATATGRDIQATSGRDSFTGVAVQGVPVTRHHPLPLPTPPNSISPALPPHGLKAQLQQVATPAFKLEPVESDLDLHDAAALGHAAPANPQSAPASNTSAPGGLTAANLALLPQFESADAISPITLAKYHLPEILLNHGPLAIRYIFGHLTASVPGFSFIPPAKSRRLVVAALEGKGNGTAGGIGGKEGDVEFYKVDWGVWGARRLVKTAATGSGATPSLQSLSLSSSQGIPIANPGTNGAALGADRLREHNMGAGALYRDFTRPGNNSGAKAGNNAANATAKNVIEDEADKMSLDNDDLDGPAYASCSEAPEENMSLDDEDSMTDDEDWGAVGAAALRAQSYSNSVATANRFGSPAFPSSFRYGSFTKHADIAGSAFTAAGSTRQFSYDSRAMSPQHNFGGRETSPQYVHKVRANSPLNQRTNSTLAATGFSPLQRAADEQELDAIEALLSLGSV